VDAALCSLSRIFGLSKRTLKAFLDKAHAYDWLADPFARGAYSYEAVNAAHARAELAKPIANTLFFAGEATDSSGQASTVAGALASGDKAARRLLALL
jgi:monoamine oxidase